MGKVKDKSKLGKLLAAEGKMVDGFTNYQNIFEIRLGTKVVYQKKQFVPFTFTILSPSIIDLEPLWGIDLEGINWGDGFTSYNTFSHQYTEPGTYTIYCNFNEIYEISDDFLNNVNLQSANFDNFYSVKRIGSNFLSNNQNLKTVEMNSLGFLLFSIGDYFLSYTGIENINLNLFNKVNSIGDNFLEHCSSLSQLSMKNMIRLMDIGDDFLKDCSGLEKLYTPAYIFEQEDPSGGDIKLWPPRLKSWGSGLDNLQLLLTAPYYQEYYEAPVWLEKRNAMNPGYNQWKTLFNKILSWSNLYNDYDNWGELYREEIN